MINQVLTFAEAESIYNLSAGTLRKYVNQTPKDKSRLRESIDYRKSGKTWLITREAMIRIYGKEEINMKEFCKKIADMVWAKMQQKGIMGTEDCKIEFEINEEEKMLVLADNFEEELYKEMKGNWFWSFEEGNNLYILYSEE